jgi:hypothetical protein
MYCVDRELSNGLVVRSRVDLQQPADSEHCGPDPEVGKMQSRQKPTWEKHFPTQSRTSKSPKCNWANNKNAWDSGGLIRHPDLNRNGYFILPWRPYDRLTENSTDPN